METCSGQQRYFAIDPVRTGLSIALMLCKSAIVAKLQRTKTEASRSFEICLIIAAAAQKGKARH